MTDTTTASTATTMLVKITEFVGEASGDGECFCFDRRSPEEAERDRSLADDINPEDEVAYQKAIDERIDREDRARIYPNDLLPDGSHDYRKPRRGKWRITVDFTPDGAEAPTTTNTVTK